MYIILAMFPLHIVSAFVGNTTRTAVTFLVEQAVPVGILPRTCVVPGPTPVRRTPPAMAVAAAMLLDTVSKVTVALDGIIVTLKSADLPTPTYHGSDGNVTRTMVIVGPTRMVLPNLTRSQAVPPTRPLTVRFVAFTTTLAWVFGGPKLVFVTVSKERSDRAEGGFTEKLRLVEAPSQSTISPVENVTCTTCNVAVSLQLGKPEG